MTEEERIMKLIIEKQSWEEVLYQIVSIENLNPWNIDLVKLVDKFISYLNLMEELDFRLPARVVFVAAVLLRLKADYLSIFEEEETIEEMAAKQSEIPDLGIDPNLIKLGLPMKRIPKRQITIDELITAMRKALEVRERRTRRRQLWQTRLQANIAVEEDITKRIERIMNEIEKMLERRKEEKLKFKQLVHEWNRDQIVSHFIPLLHLSHNNKIIMDQEEFFKEIYISKKSKY